MSKEIDGETHCLRCGNEYMEGYEYIFHMCTDCLSDASDMLMGTQPKKTYKQWRLLPDVEI